MEIIFTTDDRFSPENRQKYGQEGVCLVFEFSENDYFENKYISKALGKSHTVTNQGNNPESEEIGFCELTTPINWRSKIKKMELMGDSCSESPESSHNGEDVDEESGLSFFSWLCLNAKEDDIAYSIDDDGYDKVSRALVEDLWNKPLDWFHFSEDDSDESDSDDESFECTESDEM